jgi:hypothetical protein
MDKQLTQHVKQDFFLLDQPQKEMLSSLEKFFSELITGHTAYQIKNFIIGQFHTPDRKHRQALRELYARYTGLIQQHYEARKLQIDIGRSEIALRQAQDKLNTLTPGNKDKYAADLAALDVEEAKTDLEFKRWQLENLKLAVKETLREMVIFKQELDRLASQRKYASYEEAEPEYWQTQYVIERLGGKSLNQLPPIPNRGEIEAQISRKLSVVRRQSGKKKKLTDDLRLTTDDCFPTE